MKPAVNEIYNPDYDPDLQGFIEKIMKDSPFSQYGLTDSHTTSKYWPQIEKEVEIPGPFIILAAALPYREWDSETGNEKKLIAPFAAHDHYREAVNLMKGIWREIREHFGLTSSDGRIYCNSGIPEKELAVLSGMGFTGKNSLHIIGRNNHIECNGPDGKTEVRSYTDHISGPEDVNRLYTGSRHVLVLLMFKSEQIIPEPEKPRLSCGTCRKCIEACPTGAINEKGGINRELCLQHHTSRYGTLPETVQNNWGMRLYGCDICQQACPHNAKTTKPPFLKPQGLALKSLKEILADGPEELEKSCRGTSLRFKWIDKKALFRNALLSAAGSNDPAYLPLVSRYTKHEDSVIAETADRAVSKISERHKP